MYNRTHTKTRHWLHANYKSIYTKQEISLEIQNKFRVTQNKNENQISHTILFEKYKFNTI
jgi:hypothetical protein